MYLFNKRYSILRKLQLKTLIPAQLIGYALTLLVGVSVVLLIFQMYLDVKPLLTQQTDVFKAHTVTVSKNVTVFKTANKEGLYFTEKELNCIERQDFVEKVACFTSSEFNVSASINLGDGHRLSTDLFFESVPDDYLDVESDAWEWDSTSDFLPIVIPEDYLNLYNFGFAESQSLPVVSQSTLQQVSFNILIEGNGSQRLYTSRIVGFSGKINSILVPDDFLHWANIEYGNKSIRQDGVAAPSRLLVEFSDATDERIPAFFQASGLNISKSELESGKIAFIFRFALLFVFAIALIIIFLSVAFIIMSMNLIMQKNNTLLSNLYKIGYPSSIIAGFYQITVSMVTTFVVAIALLIALMLRCYYMEHLTAIFTASESSNIIVVMALVLLAVLLVIYNILLKRLVCKTVS